MPFKILKTDRILTTSGWILNIIYLSSKGANNMDSFREILITYRENQERPYICLQNFLALCGAVVVGKRIRGDFELLDTGIFSLCILFNDYNNPTNLKIGENVITLYLNSFSEQDNNESCKDLLVQLIERLEDKNLDAKVMGFYKWFIDVYLENSLRIHEYNCQCFFYDEKLMYVAYSSYHKTEQRLFVKQQNEYSENIQEIPSALTYARCYCIWRMY